MAIEISSYTANMEGAVKEFNKRLKSGRASHQFPEKHIPNWLPKIESRKIYQEYFLALEGGSTVRGGYMLKHEEASFRGQFSSLACLQFPLSEGIVDKAYNLMGVQLLTNALKRQPRLYALGMGGYQEPLPKMLRAMGWTFHTIPFFFKVNHPFKFLKNIQYLRKSSLKRAFLDAAALSGAGWVTIKAVQATRKNRSLNSKSLSVESVNDFSTWSDEIWEQCKDRYAMVAVRDSANLNTLYPSSNKRFTRLKVSENGKTAGWAVIVQTPMSNHKFFGDMRVGTIVDCLAIPEKAPVVTLAATSFLEKSGVDIIVSNQAHSSWCLALKDAGFIEGPSNFIFAASKGLSKLLQPFDQSKTEIHLNRGDGDGPIHL
jgi:hypothetical protein